MGVISKAERIGQLLELRSLAEMAVASVVSSSVLACALACVSRWALPSVITVQYVRVGCDCPTTLHSTTTTDPTCTVLDGVDIQRLLRIRTGICLVTHIFIIWAWKTHLHDMKSQTHIHVL